MLSLSLFVQVKQFRWPCLKKKKIDQVVQKKDTE